MCQGYSDGSEDVGTLGSAVTLATQIAFATVSLSSTAKLNLLVELIEQENLLKLEVHMFMWIYGWLSKLWSLFGYPTY